MPTPAGELNYLEFPRRCRPPLLGEPDALLRSRQAQAGSRPVAVVPRVQLHDPAGLRLRGTEQALRHAAADGRLGPVGQHHQRHRPRPQDGNATTLRADLAPADDFVRSEDGQVAQRSGVAQRRHAEPLRVLAILAQYGGRRRRAFPEALHDDAARRGRAAGSARRIGDQRGQEGAGDGSDRHAAWPRRCRAGRRDRAQDVRGA